MQKKTKEKKEENKRFYGNIKEISIPTVIDYIQFSCILHIKTEQNEAALFFNEGKLSNLRINDKFNISSIDEIKKWDSGIFTFCDWEHDIETEIKYLKDILHLAEILKSDCELEINSAGHKGRIRISDGKVTNSEINNKTGTIALKEMLNFIEGSITKNLFEKKSVNFHLSTEDNNNQLITNNKIDTMNVKKLNASMDALKEDLEDALIASVIWTTADGQSIAAINPQPKAAALFNQVTGSISKTLSNSGFPGLNKYYLLDLEQNTMILILVFKDHQWGMLVDSSKIQLGLLLNVAMPNAFAGFEDALKG
jgi:hypothetical protein